MEKSETGEPQEQLASDFSLIAPESVEKRDAKAFKFFKEEMQGKQYGAEALNTAWYWYKAGWHEGAYEGTI